MGSVMVIILAIGNCIIYLICSIELLDLIDSIQLQILFFWICSLYSYYPGRSKFTNWLVLLIVDIRVFSVLFLVFLGLCNYKGCLAQSILLRSIDDPLEHELLVSFPWCDAFAHMWPEPSPYTRIHNKHKIEIVFLMLGSSFIHNVFQMHLVMHIT